MREKGDLAGATVIALNRNGGRAEREHPIALSWQGAFAQSPYHGTDSRLQPPLRGGMSAGREGSLRVFGMVDTFGDALRVLREAVGMTSPAVGAKVNYGRGYIGNGQAGEVRPQAGR